MSVELPPTAFVDTNVFVCAFATDCERCSPVARWLVRDAAELSAGGVANP